MSQEIPSVNTRPIVPSLTTKPIKSGISSRLDAFTDGTNHNRNIEKLSSGPSIAMKSPLQGTPIHVKGNQTADAEKMSNAQNNAASTLNSEAVSKTKRFTIYLQNLGLDNKNGGKKSGTGIERSESDEKISSGNVSGKEGNAREKRKSFNPFSSLRNGKSGSNGPNPLISKPVILSVPDNPMVNSVLSQTHPSPPQSAIPSSSPEHLLPEEHSSSSVKANMPLTQTESSASPTKPLRINIEPSKEFHQRSGPSPLSPSTHSKIINTPPSSPQPLSAVYETKKKMDGLEEQVRQLKNIVDELLLDNKLLHHQLNQVNNLLETYTLSNSSAMAKSNAIDINPTSDEHVKQIHSKVNAGLSRESNDLGNAVSVPDDAKMKYAWSASDKSEEKFQKKVIIANEDV